MGPVDCKAKAFMSKIRSTESSEQQAFFVYVRYKMLSDKRYAAVASIPNGGHRHPLVAMKMSREGITRGVSDVFCWVPASGLHGLAIEFKAAGGRLSKEQKIWMDRLREFGYGAVVVWNATEAIEVLTKYLDNKLEGEACAKKIC